jgi:hypothetical protein
MLPGAPSEGAVVVPTLDALTPQAATNPARLAFPTLEEIAALLPDVPEVHRFLEKVEVGPTPQHRPDLGPCLLWTRARTRDGYATFRGGHLTPGGPRQVAGHIWLHHQLHGPVPAGMELDHICHDPRLCKPAKANLCPHRPCVLHTAAKPVAVNRLRVDNVPGRNAVKQTCDGEYSPRTADGTLIGHDWSIPGNMRVRLTNEGRLVRVCVPCHNARQAAWVGRARRLKAAAAERGMQQAGQLELLTG